MNSVIIIDEDKKSYSRLYFNYSNGSLDITGNKIVNNNIENITNEEIDSLKELFIPNQMNYLTDEDGYKVYIDENNLKHYKKDDQEDYYKFLQANDLGAYEYSKIDPNSFAEEKSFKVKKGKKTFLLKVKDAALLTAIIATISVSGLAIIGNDLYYDAPKQEPQSVAYEDEASISSDNYYGIFEEPSTSTYDYSVSVDEIIGLIESSNLDDNFKGYYNQSRFFEDVLEYYKGTAMEVLIRERLDGLEIKYYDPEEASDEVLLGYYNSLEPNVIYLNSGYNYEFCAAHEFVHLFQNPYCTKTFFREAMADIVSTEYFNETFNSYNNQDYLLKLLINTIGPIPIWEYTFNGDYSKIDNTFKEYLSEEDYNKLNTLLDATEFDEEFNAELEELFATLYLNMYNEPIYNNPNIFDPDGDLIKKSAYFNIDLIASKEYSVFYDTYSDNILTMFPDQRILTKNNNKTR